MQGYGDLQIIKTTMTYSNIFLLLLIATMPLIASGQIQSVDNYQTINVLPQTEIIKFSAIFKDYKIIRLKSDNSHYLKTVTRVIPSNDKLVIQAKSENSSIHLFNQNGDYLFNVGSIGRGPSEYLTIRSFKVYPIQQQIEILDYGKNSILRYSLETGKYLSNLKIAGDISPDDFERDNNGLYIFFEKMASSQDNSLRNKLTVYSKENKLINGLLPYNTLLSKNIFFGEFTNLYSIDSSICFYTLFIDTIYTIQPFQKKIKYVFNLGRYLIKKDILITDYKDPLAFGEKCIESLCIWDINRIIETRDNVFFSFRYGKDFYYSFYNKTSKRTIASNRFNDDMILNRIGGSTEMINPVGKGENSLFFRLETVLFIKSLDDLKKTLSQNDWAKYCDTHKKVIELYNTLDINENDLIIEFQLKDRLSP